ncbi:MAG: hypothetical protein ACLFN8_01755 [Candidatus Woesearchaeota archaeon]
MLNLDDLKSRNILIDESANYFFCSDLFNFLNNNFDEYSDVLSSFEKRFKSSGAFGRVLNNKIRFLMKDSLEQYLVDDVKRDLFNSNVLLFKQTLDVSFQGVVNYNISENNWFDLWEFDDLFMKTNFKKVVGDSFFIHNIIDFSQDVRTYFSQFNSWKVRSFYSKLDIEELSLLVETRASNTSDDFVKKSKVGKTHNLEVGSEFYFSSASKDDSLNLAGVESNYIDTFNKLYPETKDFVNVDEDSLYKIKEIYEVCKLADYKRGGNKISEEKIPFYLDVLFGKNCDGLISFLSTNIGVAFLSYDGQVTDSFLRRIYERRERILSVFNKDLNNDEKYRIF